MKRGKSNRRYSNITVEAKQRKLDLKCNSNISFDKVEDIEKISNEKEDEIFKYVIQRFKEKSFDNFRIEEIKDSGNDEDGILSKNLCESNKGILELWECIEESIKSLTIKSYK